MLTRGTLLLVRWLGFLRLMQGNLGKSPKSQRRYYVGITSVLRRWIGSVWPVFGQWSVVDVKLSEQTVKIGPGSRP